MNAIDNNVDLTNCDREPIHKLGLIQDFGALIALNSDWFVAFHSENVDEIFGAETGIEQGTKIAEVFAEPAMARLREAAGNIDEFLLVDRIFAIDVLGNGKLFDCAVHRSGEVIVLEFEPHPEGEYLEQMGSIRPMMSELEKHRDVNYLCNAAAMQLRKVLGFDRVMVYRFHADQSGEVVAEARDPKLESFLNLRYPKSDIPAQARALYVLNPFRIISDVDATPVEIVPSVDLEGNPIDLSLSTLRSVSPIHIEYLKNMGVKASLSISIIVDGKLWGLFACHHYSPSRLPFPQRTLAELYSQLFSLMLDRLLNEWTARLRDKGRAIHDRLMAKLAGGDPLGESLSTIDQVIGQIIPHDGSSAYIDGSYNTRGIAPSKDEFRSLLATLNSAPNSKVFASEALATKIPAARAFDDRVVGALFIPVSRRPRDYLVFWRRELRQTVNWAGNPEKPVEYGPNGARLTPRKSFEAWQQEVTGKSAEWSEDEVQIAESLRVTLLEVILRMTDEAVQERARAQEQQELLISELNHRVRNILNLIRSLINQSRHEAMNVEDFSALIGGRIGALAAAHDNITKENWSHASLKELLNTEAEAYLGGKQDRLAIVGGDRLIAPEAYTVLALVLHEMVTNSAKYGSLCDSSGTLTITLSEDHNGDLVIDWRERGGPPVQPPKRRGFGSTIIERSIPYELKGEAEQHFKLEGLEARFVIPQSYVVQGNEEGDNAVSSKPAAVSGQGMSDGAALPKRILVVEDSMLIALDTEDCLEQLGVKEIDIAGSVNSAFESIAEKEPDFCILDYNLGTESSDPVATELRKRKIPFVLATGYGEMADRLDDIGALGLLKKPYGKAELETALTLYANAGK